MYLLYHNPRCSKSRDCLKIVKNKKVDIKEKLYLKDGLSNVELNKIINSLLNPISDLVRTNEKKFKSKPFDLNSKKLVISFLHKNPICLQRPLFFNGKNYIICRPPETVLNYI